MNFKKVCAFTLFAFSSTSLFCSEHTHEQLYELNVPLFLPNDFLSFKTDWKHWFTLTFFSFYGLCWHFFDLLTLRFNFFISQKSRFFIHKNLLFVWNSTWFCNSFHEIYRLFGDIHWIYDLLLETFYFLLSAVITIVKLFGFECFQQKKLHKTYDAVIKVIYFLKIRLQFMLTGHWNFILKRPFILILELHRVWSLFAWIRQIVSVFVLF